MNENRNKRIVRTSILGIVMNVLLSAFKIIIGTLTNSIAIVLDAVNNLSDAASSVITIVGAKLAGREPDKKHPFGHGRIEYFSALIISILVLYAGITSLEESVKSIIHPETPSYSTVSLIIIAAAVVIKFILGRYFVRVGEKADSPSLVNSGKDAMLDSVISFSTLAAAVFYLLTNVSVEAYLGIVISAVILKAGCDMLMEIVSKLLGERVDYDKAKAIADTIREFHAVNGVYDLVLNDYGPDSFQGSVHIEVPDTYTASDLDKLIRSITLKVLEKHNVLLTAIGIYSINTQDPHVIEVRKKITDIALSHEFITQIHGFYLEEDIKSIRFDLVVSLDAKDRKCVYNEVVAAVKLLYPEYRFNVAMDIDFIASQGE
ncbi:MAG: cation diffusion facilitator family transporter [Clostridiaceae bacterium]|nr:cation diffusion facilitator family transporter [Clostridiaceae bacterium]